MSGDQVAALILLFLVLLPGLIIFMDDRKWDRKK